MTPDLPQADRWRRRRGIDIHWRDWGGDSVAFEASSGDTHLIAPFTAAVMAYFETAPRCSRELLAALAADLGGDIDDELEAALAASVRQLLDLGWIEAIIRE